MLPRQGEMGENTPFTRKCSLEPSKTLERVTTSLKTKMKSDKPHLDSNCRPLRCQVRTLTYVMGPSPSCFDLQRSRVLVYKKNSRLGVLSWWCFAVINFLKKIYFIVRKLTFKKYSFACHCY